VRFNLFEASVLWEDDINTKERECEQGSQKKGFCNEEDMHE